jgi:hypothetical protein
MDGSFTTTNKLHAKAGNSKNYNIDRALHFTLLSLVSSHATVYN